MTLAAVAFLSFMLGCWTGVSVLAFVLGRVTR